MKKQYIHILILLVGFFGAEMSVNAQQVSLFNNNIANPFTINPSMAGRSGSAIYFHHRRQWVGVQGAPEKTMFTSEWRLKNSQTAIGFTFNRDQSNVIANNSGYASLAHHFELKKEHQLSFGASIGVRHNSIDFNRVNVHDPGDDLVFANGQNSTNFDGKFGMTYGWKGLEVQATGLQLFGNKTVYDNSFDGKFLEYTFVRHFVTSVGYQFQAKQVGIKPIVQIKGIQGSRLQPEGILRLDFKNQIWVAGHYVLGASAAVSGGVAIQDKYVIGYSAEFATTPLANYNAGTHELMFGIKLGSLFSKDDNHKKIQQLESNIRTYDERQQYLKEENKQLQEEMDRQRDRIKELKAESPQMDYAEIKRIVDKETSELRAEIEDLKKKQAEQAVSARGNPSGNTKTSSAGSAEYPVMLPSKDYYVVIATAKGPKRAYKYVKKAQKKFDLKTVVIHPENNPYYFVSPGGFDDREAARLELLRVFRMNTTGDFNGKPWIFE